mgnify:CR=1 FL=1
MNLGYIPSFCTACYREGRTGDRFMSLCKSGQIQNCCHPNALMTLEEYLVDYASDDTRNVGQKLIEQELEKIPNEKVRTIVFSTGSVVVPFLSDTSDIFWFVTAFTTLDFPAFRLPKNPMCSRSDDGVSFIPITPSVKI